MSSCKARTLVKLPTFDNAPEPVKFGFGTSARILAAIGSMQFLTLPGLPSGIILFLGMPVLAVVNAVPGPMQSPTRSTIAV